MNRTGNIAINIDTWHWDDLFTIMGSTKHIDISRNEPLHMNAHSNNDDLYTIMGNMVVDRGTNVIG